jgi:hypothetical protein
VDPTLSDLEQLLRRSRPQPSPEFVRELGASLRKSVQGDLLESPRPRLHGARRLRLAFGSAVAIAALLLLLSIAGLRPFGTGGTTGAKADRECVTVQEWVLAREPTLVVADDGHLRVQYHTELVARPRVRCR